MYKNLQNLITSKKMKNLDIDTERMFDTADQIKKAYIEANGSEELSFQELDLSSEEYKKAINELLLKSNSHNVNLVGSELKKIQNQVDGIKSKILKDQKGQFEKAMSSIDQMKQKLFPDGGLQERSANFFSFCADGEYKTKLDNLYAAVDPFENDFIVLRDE